MMSTDNERQLAFLASALEEANGTIRANLDELSLVRRVGDAISAFASMTTLSSELARAVAETVFCRYAAIYAGSTGAPFQLQAVSSVFGCTDVFPESIADSKLARIIKGFQTPVQIDDLSACSEWTSGWPFPRDLVAWLFVPLVEGKNLRGVLCLADDRSHAFDERTLRTMMVVVPQIASAITKIELYEHVRASEEKYRTLVESMHDVVFICEPDWRISAANAAAERLFGESIINKALSDLFSSPEIATQFLERVRNEHTVQNFEAEFAGAHGERLVVLVSCSENGGRYSGMIKDVTERARLVDQVIRAQRMESVGTLAAGVAHDFNNILAIILPNAELIKLRAQGEPSILKFSDVIINASRRANDLTRQLLSLARREPRQLRTLNLNDAIRSTCKLFEDTIGKKLQVHTEFEAEPATIRSDESQLEQILLNLSINARDAMPNGGSLRFHTHTEGNQIVLRVKDSGTGIDRNVLPKIFDPFFTTKEKSKGTGLGLSVVYNLIKQMGGSIDVASQLGQGTEFTLSFPLCPEKMDRPTAPDGVTVGGTEKILIVDDEPEMIELLQTALVGAGYTVVAARNGLEALEAVSDEFQLVIMDMRMPVMDGLTAVRGIRQKLPHMKIVVASGYTNPENIPILERMGVEALVSKPFELQKLTSLIRDVLDGVTV